MHLHPVTSSSAARRPAGALTLILIALLLFPGCGGKQPAVQPDDAASALSSVPAGGGGGGGGNSEDSPSVPPGNLVQVRMKPAPIQPPPFELAAVQRGVSAGRPGAAQLGAPKTLLQQLGAAPPAGSRQVSFDPSDLMREGSSFDLILPYHNVEPDNMLPSAALFSPNALPAVQLGDLAYAVYKFQLLDYSDTTLEQTLGLNFEVDPSDPSNVWIGLGNQQTNKWDWFMGEGDGVVTFGSFAPYEAGDGSVLIALVVLGMEQLKLLSLQIGEFETRGTGDLALPPDTPVSHMQYPDFPLTFFLGVDLSPDCAPIGDQGGVGACTAFATADGALNYDLGQLYEDYCWDLTDNFFKLSPRFVYNQTGVDLGGSCPTGGRTTMDVTNWLVSNGASTEDNAPFGSNSTAMYNCDEDWSADALADADLLHPASSVFIGTIHPVSGKWYLDDADINDCRTVLRVMDKPLIFRTFLDGNFSAVDYEGGGSWTYSGPPGGGHAMLIVGYDDDRNGGSFKVRNSWGTNWGDDGYCWITYDSMQAPGAEVYAQYIITDFDPDVLDRFCPGPIFTLPPYQIYVPDFFPDRIRIEWTPPPGVFRYMVFRDQQEQAIGTVQAPDTFFEDKTVDDGNAHIYWLKAVNGQGLESSFSAPVVGWLLPAV